ncbi:MAG: HD domain-containing protein [Bacteroidota bacterium]
MQTLTNDFLRIMLNSEKPSEFFEYLKKNNKLGSFSELYFLIITCQDATWHPEGSVWTHTLMVIDVAAEFRNTYHSEKDALAFMLGALCHDFGKPYTTIMKQGRIKSPLHDLMGLPPTKSFLNKLGLDEFFSDVSVYIMEHLKPIQLYKNRENVSDAAILRLSKRINIYDLYKLSASDHWGRTDEEATKRIHPAGEWLLQRYKSILEKEKASSVMPA